MLAILKKELNSYFSSLTAYAVVGVFLLTNGLFLWVFDDDFNILNAGFADINSFFYLSPWLLMFLVPAITMKSFAGEYENGTIETLVTKPISKAQIILGKFLASFLLILLGIVPTLVYVFSVSELGKPIGNIDLGSTFGSYFGLILLVGAFTSIGVFCSAVAKNQLIALVTAIILCFIFYYGIDSLATLLDSKGYWITSLSLSEHFKALSRGVIDSRDITYLLSVVFFFLFLTHKQLRNE